MAALTPTTLIQLTAAALSLLLAIRLRVTGLSAKYRYFFAYVIFRVPHILLGLAFGPKSWQYFVVFIALEPIEWFFYVAIVVELFQLVLQRHRGIFTIARWAIYAVLAFSVAVSIVTLLARIVPQKLQHSIIAIGFYVAADRGVYFALAIFLILMMLLLNLYTVPLSRNVIRHATICALYFLVGSAAAIVRMYYGLKYVEVTSLASSLAPCVLLLAWSALLSSRGEEVLVRAPWYGAEQEQRILSQLDALNATLLKAARK